jgi:magnesium chelatase subunit I
MSAADVLAHAAEVQGLVDLARAAGIPADAPAPLVASGVDFVLEGLYATKKISRSDERGYHGSEPAPQRAPRETAFRDETPMPAAGGKGKKYYN